MRYLLIDDDFILSLPFLLAYLLTYSPVSNKLGRTMNISNNWMLWAFVIHTECHRELFKSQINLVFCDSWWKRWCSYCVCSTHTQPRTKLHANDDNNDIVLQIPFFWDFFSLSASAPIGLIQLIQYFIHLKLSTQSIESNASWWRFWVHLDTNTRWHWLALFSLTNIFIYLRPHYPSTSKISRSFSPSRSACVCHSPYVHLRLYLSTSAINRCVCAMHTIF